MDNKEMDNKENVITNALPGKLAAICEDGPVVADKTGKIHHLRPLDFQDLHELEKHLGSLERAGNMTVSQLFFVLWLSLRKEGKTDKEIETGRYACTEVGARQMFAMGQVRDVVDAVNSLLRASGMIPLVDKGPADGSSADPTTQRVMEEEPKSERESPPIPASA